MLFIKIANLNSSNLCHLIFRQFKKRKKMKFIFRSEKKNEKRNDFYGRKTYPEMLVVVLNLHDFVRIAFFFS